jgi:L-iditol 2-dehydrogenase
VRVAMYYNNHDVRLEQMPEPKIGPGEVLMRVEASGICGSDVMEWYRIKKAPLVLGHEVSGEIVATGEGVTKYKAGERICASHHVPCNTCRYCLRGHQTVCETLRKTNFYPGGFAEFIRLPALNVDRGIYPIPEEVTYEDATFAEPLACVLRAQRMAQVRPGDSVLVLGSGIAGLLHIKLAVALGAGRIIATDISKFRLEAAKKFGAEEIVSAEKFTPELLQEINDGHLADIVIVCTNATSAFNQAVKSVDRGGTILLFAPTNDGVTIPISVNELFFRNDVTITTSYAGSGADHVSALELIRAGRVKVNDMITHRLGLAETGKGFQLVEKAEDCLKVIIFPQK